MDGLLRADFHSGDPSAFAGLHSGDVCAEDLSPRPQNLPCKAREGVGKISWDRAAAAGW